MDMGDLDEATAAFNKWADKHNDDYVAWIMTPDTFGPGNTTDVGWLGTWPDGNAYGAQQDAWMATGRKEFQGFMDAVTCDTHEMATSLPISAPEEPPENGVVMFSRCELDDDSDFDDAIAAHRAVAESMGGESGANSWLFFPGSGSTDQGSDDVYWLVLGFDNYTELGAAMENYTNGGGYEKVMDILDDVTECSGTTTWVARRATN